MSASKQANLIAVVNSKGGVGKTTLSVHLAVWLYGRGRYVTFVDADVQRSGSTWLMEAEPKIPVHQAHTAAEIQRRIPALLDAGADAVTGKATVVADGPAGLAAETRTLMLMADTVLIPCGASAMDLRAASLAVDVLHEAERIRQAKIRAYLVLNRIQTNTRLGAEASQAAEALGLKVADPAITLRTSVADVSGQGQTVFTMGAAARAAADEMNALFEGLRL
jgi:chromosome partitioning protein